MGLSSHLSKRADTTKSRKGHTLAAFAAIALLAMCAVCVEDDVSALAAPHKEVAAAKAAGAAAFCAF